MTMCNMDSKMWTVEELKTYEGDLWVDIEYEDCGCNFKAVINIHATIQEDPVFSINFYNIVEVEGFLTSLGFVNDPDLGWVR